MLESVKHPIFNSIAKAAKAKGVETYVVGGFVRDSILKRDCKDIDIVCVGSGIELAEELAVQLKSKQKVKVFKNFGTAMLQHKEWEIEFVGARKESYRKNSRKPIVEDGSLEEDQNRRDFTINALAISLNEDSFGELLDPFNGVKHIEEKLIKTPLNPAETFSDDPLRMMRAIRFATQLNFNIEEEALNAIAKEKERIKIVSQERITEELNKIILSTTPSIGFKHLYNTGLLSIIFKELEDLQGVDQRNGLSHKDNFYHTLEVLDRLSVNSNNLWLRWAAILHDIAKPPTKRFDQNQGWTFHGHEDLGARMTPEIFKRLKLPLDHKMKYVQKLVRLHLRPIALVKETVTDSAIRRLLFEAGEDIDDLMTLCSADITTKNKKKQKRYTENFKIVKTKLKEVEEKDRLRNWQPPISGEEIMNYFNINPSKEVGLLKNKIKEAILDGEIQNDKEEAFQYLIKEAKKLNIYPKGIKL